MEQTLLAVGLILVCYLAVRAPRLFRSKESPQTAQAEVLSRRGQMPDKSYSNFRGSQMNYYVVFSLGADTRELRVSSSQYARLVEGTRGTLTWQGETLVSFAPIETA